MLKISHHYISRSRNRRSLATIDDTEFFDMCRLHGVEFNFEEWSQNSWRYISDTFGTNFRTNIMLHLYSRLKNWFNFRLRDGRKWSDLRGKENRKVITDQLYHTMKFLFSNERSSKPEIVRHQLIEELQKICRFPDFGQSGESYFSRLYEHHSGKTKTNPKKVKFTKKQRKPKKSTKSIGPRLIWMQMVPAMIRLQRWIHTTNMSRNDSKRKKKRKRKRKRTRPTPENADDKTKPKPKRNRRKKSNRVKDDDDGEKIHHRKLQNFIVVPQHSFSMKHFAIDSKLLFDLVKNLNAFKTTGNGAGLYTQNEFLDLVEEHDNANVKTVNPFWHLLFKIQKFESEKKKFGGRLTTNSSDVSVQFCRIKDKYRMTRDEVFDMANRKRKAEKEIDESDGQSDDDSDSTGEPDDSRESERKTDVDPVIVQQLQQINLKNVSVSGVDLGMRNMAATIIRTWDNSEILETNVLHKSKDFHYKAGFLKRQRLRRKLVGSFEKQYQHDRRSNGQEPSPKSGNYRQFLNSRLKWFNQATETYMRRQIVNLNFDKYNSTQKTMTEMAKEMVGDVDLLGQKKIAKDCRIVFMGDCSTPANSKVRGHMRSPGDTRISRYLKQRRNTIVIRQDEYCTTKNCSRCYGELDSVESTKDRLKICKKICIPHRNSMPAHHIYTNTPKRSIKRKMEKSNDLGTKPNQDERKTLVPKNPKDRWTDLDVLRISKRHSLKAAIYNGQPINARIFGCWNRDINAARNIAYLGLCRYGKYIDNIFNFNENIAFSRSHNRE